MGAEWNGVISVLDRPGGADSEVLRRFGEETPLRRLLPSEVEDLDPATEVLLIRGGFWSDLERLLELAPGLKWIHVNMAGVDHLDLELLNRRGVILTNSSGVLDRPIAEFVLGAALLWAKGLHRSVLETQRGEWCPREPLLHASLSVLVVGAGGIGTRCAELFKLAGFGRVAGARRSERPLGPEFDERVEMERLGEALPEFDVVVSCLPAAAGTANIFDAETIRRFRERMVFINVGRGVVLDHEALAALLLRRPEMLAVLDVTEPEPLPPGHPLRQRENLVISPHMAGETVERHDNFSRLFIDNLRRYTAGQPMRNQLAGPAVGPSAGGSGGREQP